MVRATRGHRVVHSDAAAAERVARSLAVRHERRTRVRVRIRTIRIAIAGRIAVNAAGSDARVIRMRVKRLLVLLRVGATTRSSSGTGSRRVGNPRVECRGIRVLIVRIRGERFRLCGGGGAGRRRQRWREHVVGRAAQVVRALLHRVAHRMPVAALAAVRAVPTELLLLLRAIAGGGVRGGRVAHTGSGSGSGWLQCLSLE